MIKTGLIAVFFSSFMITSVLAAPGFGSRKASLAPETMTAPGPATATAPASDPSIVGPQVSVKKPSKPATYAPQTFNPPVLDGEEWLRVPFDKAENEVLELFNRDVPKLEDIAQDLAIYEVRASGRLPQDYRRNLRAKMERVLLNSKRLKLKPCSTCEEARVYRDEKGDVKYESSSSDLSRPAKVASEVGVGHLIYAEISYTPEDLQMRVRMVEASTGQLRWAQDYSTADVVKTRENISDSNSNQLGHGDSLSHVMIGEIAFTTVLSPGVGMFPVVDTGTGSGMAAYPSFDLFIGEKFDRGRKVFGFLIGGAFTMGSSEGEKKGGKPLPWALRLAPRFRYVFNPYNMSTARYSVAVEVGGFISAGLTTAYVGLGPEISMINRFSVSLTPVYIFPSTVTGTQVFNETNNGMFSSSGSKGDGTFGGLGALVKASINW